MLWRGHGLTGNDPATQPADAHDFAPVLAVDSHRRPTLFAPAVCATQQLHTRTRVFCNADVAIGYLTRVQLWICEIGPDRRYAHGVGLDAHPEATVHVGSHV